MTTPREALEPLLCLNGNGPIKNGPVIASIDAILTALAPFLRTPGTVEVCGDCLADLNWVRNFGCKHKLGDTCPLKPKE